jgi:hypothetical protein
MLTGRHLPDPGSSFGRERLHSLFATHNQIYDDIFILFVDVENISKIISPTFNHTGFPDQNTGENHFFRHGRLYWECSPNTPALAGDWGGSDLTKWSKNA